MEIKKKILLFGLLFVMIISIISTSVNAYTIVENNLMEEYQITKEEEETFLSSIEETVTTEDGTEYTLNSLTKEEDEDNTITVEVTETKNSLSTNNESTIRSLFGEEYNYSEDGYSGTLSISNISIQTVSQGTYEQIEDLDIDFTNYTMNDLNNIEKTYSYNGYTWYLIDVDWEVQDSQTIDDQEVATYYQGTIHYQTIVEYDNPYLYNVTVTYSGEVTRDNPVYNYTAIYDLVEVEAEVIVEEPEEDTNYMPAVIVSVVGLILVILLFVLLNKNTKVYNKTENGKYKVVKKVNLSNNNMTINLSDIDYKTNTNLYMIKVNKSAYKKLQNQGVTLEKGNRRISIILSNQISEFKF